ncbi:MULTISPECIES: fimbria/pilus outer membrane usher protein [unclassified Serratia (in: enterobacteria)]|uniref:fimbria/pilus outer membrane usher protein n=1 Tax=unclassified Serratia (in: enterobacteria) TaxID=2647522 RepID=UPI00050847CD|nr:MULTISPECIES: fimbria/pilus outer membrane usher protein [unclassified Serratia (in: enterobacteria)]KFK96797.1 fimbrial assembly protein [Serratia sp. Ag2]KFK97340.1 fimbrial assembly protein [Serratia sp. Ag1]
MNFIKVIYVTSIASLMGLSSTTYAVEFNTDILDTEDKQNIDLSRFAVSGYVMPGPYQLVININQRDFPEQTVNFTPRDDNPNSSEPCLSENVVALLGLKQNIAEKITYGHQNHCADLKALDGITMRTDLSAGTLYISIPQALIEYRDHNWLPPSSWDDGIPGLLLDYNLNSQVNRPQQSAAITNTNVNGTAGANYGPWRLRGDYQGNYTKIGNGQSQNNFEWNRFYLYRSIRSLASTLTVGENYFSSDIFSLFRYTGLSLASDERMLPPNLRGYAPEVAGIARTNAKVIVSQQGRLLYQTTVPSGPFRIMDLDSSISGLLDVRVEEQDGSVQTFQINTATIPYLTRPGTLRYKIAFGRPANVGRRLEGSPFASGEFSRGISNSWSLYGGGIAAGHYNSLSAGIGRDLYVLGALSADATQSWATNLPGQPSQQGKSYRLSYAKRFDQLDSEVTFAGYRFSQRQFMTMSQYLDTRYRGDNSGNSKEMYTVMFNKNFPDARVSLNLSYSHQTYWEQQAADNFSLSLNHYFDVLNIKDVSTNLSAGRSKNNGVNENTLFLSFSVPLGNQQYVSYSGQHSQGGYNQTVSYLNSNGENSNYRLSTGLNNQQQNGTKSQFSGFYTQRSSMAQLSLNSAYVQDSYTSYGMSLKGGATVTTKGAGLHGSNVSGGTRLMLSTDGIAGVPIEGRNLSSNRFGIAVLNDIAGYYRTDTRIDINQLADDVEARQLAVESALTEGAIGYRRFSLVKGLKAIATLRKADGSYPPFGSSVTNSKGQELAIISDDGFAYLSGVSVGETLDVAWNGSKQCQVNIPEKLQPQSQLLLPCHSTK